MAKCTGYDADEILARALDAALKVKRGEAIYERDSVVFNHIEYAWPLLSCLMWVAARNHGKLSVLDFGGALGSSYFQNRKFLEMLVEVRWSVVEQPNYVAAGVASIQDAKLRFYRSVKECLSETPPDVVLMSSVLQYLPDPYAALTEILDARVQTLILDRASYTNYGEKERITIQHVPASIYQASYPCWILAEDAVVALITRRGYRLVEVFDALDKFDSAATWKGHIFEKLPCV